MDEDLCLHSLLFMPENGLMQKFPFFHRLVDMAQYAISGIPIPLPAF